MNFEISIAEQKLHPETRNHEFVFSGIKHCQLCKRWAERRLGIKINEQLSLYAPEMDQALRLENESGPQQRS